MAKPPVRITKPAAKAGKPASPELPGDSTSFPVVAVGASAGGLEAMTELLANLPERTGMAFLFIQHAAPNRESLLTDILSRSSRMPLREVKKGMKIEPDRGYVVPPGFEADLEDDRFALIPDGSRARD